MTGICERQPFFLDWATAAGTTICIVSPDSSKLSTVWIGQLCGQLYRIMALPNIAYDYCDTSMTSKFGRSWDRNRSFAITSGIKQGCVMSPIHVGNYAVPLWHRLQIQNGRWNGTIFIFKLHERLQNGYCVTTACPFYTSKNQLPNCLFWGITQDRAIHKDALAKLHVEFCRLMGMVVGPPTCFFFLSIYNYGFRMHGCVVRRLKGDLSRL